MLDIFHNSDNFHRLIIDPTELFADRLSVRKGLPSQAFIDDCDFRGVSVVATAEIPALKHWNSKCLEEIGAHAELICPSIASTEAGAYYTYVASQGCIRGDNWHI